MTRSLRLAFAFALGLSSPFLLAQGSLTPPPGPPSPNMKTLTEVEPRIAVNAFNTPGDANSVYVISQSGSCYLTGNLIAPDGKHGITINANQVTLDLMGFKVPGGASSGSGIRSFGQNIAIRNGFVMQWFLNGLDLGFRNRIDNVQVLHHNGTGIKPSNFCEVTNCLVDSNAKGIEIGFESTVTGCRVSGNTFLGIGTGARSRIARSTVNGTTIGPGLSNGAASSIIDCIASSNVTGFVTLGGCTVEGGTASGNITGFTFQNGSIARRCSASSNTANGMDLSTAGGGAAGVLIEDGSASGNTGPTPVNYDIAPSNSYGPIVDVTGAGNLAAVPNANHPWANFVH